ncbi:MAG: T9SS type A sorting domain-containing protein [Bacteroidota bacterium]|nr:T9SS type A sorting domain-containing protein [Bacteroidota bacterium]
MKLFAIILAFLPSFLFPQDTITYQWPFEPFHSTQLITGTFCEFRNTLSSNHFHDGTDIPKADGSAVYPVLSGTVFSLGTSATEGTSSYVRVKTFIEGKWKHISYVHMEPNPTLSIGMSVTVGVTVLGNILSGQGHVHLRERELVESENSTGVDIGALREPGGLKPYVDTYSPKILWVKFFQDNSNIEFTTKKIFGNVDFIAQMVERNTDGLPNSSSTTNNGVYHTGYKIYTSGKDSIVYTPPASGTRYKFDYKPLNEYANVVYTLQSNTTTHIYILTNGTGNHGISTSTANRTVNNNYFASNTLPAGNYQLMVYAIDTHGNADTVFSPFEISTQDVVSPSIPFLKSVLNDSINQVTISWYANTEPDLKNYRLYFSTTGTTWNIYPNENTLTSSVTKLTIKNTSSQTPVYFKLTAIDSAAFPNESGFSDIYGLRPNSPGQKILVIDAFDRISGSYKQPSHPFAMTTGQSINARFETAHNKAVMDGSIQLSNYSAVVWLFGDEGSTDETFGAAEQTKAIAYLNSGGKIFSTGSEIAYDLDRPSGPSQADRDFLRNNLKTSYAEDASGSYTINGSVSTVFEGLSFAYGDIIQGSPYNEDYPDYLNPINGSSVVLKYANNLNAATAFNGSVIVLGIPFETIHTKANRDALMNAALKYFDIATSVVEHGNGNIPSSFSLEQNYPNPFNPITKIRFSLANNESATLRIFDVLGKEITTLINEQLIAGTYDVSWDATAYPSGVYFYRLQTKDFSQTKKLVLTK